MAVTVYADNSLPVSVSAADMLFCKHQLDTILATVQS